MNKVFIDLAALTVLCLRSSNAQITEIKLTASDGDSFDSFAISISIDGDYVIVGDIGDDDNGDRSGWVVQSESGWLNFMGEAEKHAWEESSCNCSAGGTGSHPRHCVSPALFQIEGDGRLP